MSFELPRIDTNDDTSYGRQDPTLLLSAPRTNSSSSGKMHSIQGQKHGQGHASFRRIGTGKSQNMRRVDSRESITNLSRGSGGGGGRPRVHRASTDISLPFPVDTAGAESGCPNPHTSTTPVTHQRRPSFGTVSSFGNASALGGGFLSTARAERKIVDLAMEFQPDLQVSTVSALFFSSDNYCSYAFISISLLTG